MISLTRFPTAIFGLLLAFSISVINAQDIWIGPPGTPSNWFSNGNWSLGAPPNGAQDARIDNGGIGRINAGAATANTLTLGNAVGDSGEVRVNNASTLTLNNNFIVGDAGTGTAGMQDTSVTTVAGRMAIGNQDTGVGNATVRDSARLTITGNLNVGDRGTGTLTIRGASKTVTQSLLILGNATGSLGTVDVSGTFAKGSNDFNLTSDGNTVVGNGSAGANELDIHNGGRVATGDSAIIGNGTGSNGLVRVRDDGTASESYWFIQNDLTVGNLGTGELQIRDGGFAGTFSGNIAIGRLSGSMGTVSVAGSGALDGPSLLQAGATLVVGDDGTGHLRISDGGNVTAADASVGNSAGSSGEIVIRDDATLSTTNNLTVANRGSGTMEIHDTGVVTTGGNGTIGNIAGSTGEVRVTDNGNWTITGNLTVGGAGDGTLRVVNSESNPLVEANLVVIGDKAGSMGLVVLDVSTMPDVISAAMLISNSDTVVGNLGDGTMRILNGAFGASLGNAIIGRGAGGTGKVVVSGLNVYSSEWDIGGDLTVGNAGSGILDILDGGLVGSAPFDPDNAFIGKLAGSTGKVTVDGAGSTLNVDNRIFVGGDSDGPGGDGELRITAGGTVNAINLTVWGAGSGGPGVLAVDSGYTINSGITFDGGILRFLDDTDFINDATLATTTGPVGLIVDTNGTTSTISGLLSGPGRLVKRDDGTLILTNHNTYTGRTIIEQGTVQIDGSVAGTVSVRVDGTLTGVYDGMVDNVGRNLRNRGIVSPGDSEGEPATFQVTRNFINRTTGSYFVDVGGLDQGVDTDLLRMFGTATLEGGTLQATRINNFQAMVGDRVVVLQADLGRTGEFDTVVPIGWGLIQPVADYSDPDQVALLFELSQTFGSQALTPNQKAVGHGLDHALADGCVPELVTFVGNITPLEALPHVYDLIAPEELAAVYEIGISQAMVHNDNLMRRMDDIRAGSNGYCGPVAQPAMTASNPPISDKNVVIPDKNVVMDKNVAPLYVPCPENHWGIFATGTGDFVNVDGDGNAHGYDIDTGSFIAGVDYRIGNHFAIGIDGGYASSRADLVDHGHIDVDGGKIGGYATVYGFNFLGGKIHLDGGVNGGWNSYDTRRTGLSDTFADGESVNGDTNGSEFNAFISYGTDYNFGCLTIGTWSTIQYTNVSIDSFTEEGSLAPLHIQDQDQDSFRGSTGVRASYDIRFGHCGIIRPEIRAAWQHESSDRSYAIDANFIDCDDTFTVHGPKIGRDSALVGAGLNVQWCARFATYLNYDGVLGRDNYTNNAVSGGLRLGF